MAKWCESKHLPPKCRPGLDPSLAVIFGLSLLMVLVLAPRRFSPGTVFSPLYKNQHFQIPIRSGKCPLCAKYIVIYGRGGGGGGCRSC